MKRVISSLIHHINIYIYTICNKIQIEKMQGNARNFKNPNKRQYQFDGLFCRKIFIIIMFFWGAKTEDEGRKWNTH